jgi:hypothetical protein
MKLSTNASAFLLLRFDQLSSHACQRIFCSLEIGYIRYDTNHPHDSTFLVEEGSPAAA